MSASTLTVQQIRLLEKARKERLWKEYLRRRESLRRSFRCFWELRRLPMARKQVVKLLIELKNLKSWDFWYQSQVSSSKI